MNKKITLQLFILNLFLLTVYFSVLINLKTGVNAFIMFSTPDSNDYLAVGNWIFEQKETIQTKLIPFLFPLLLKVLIIIGGVTAVWFFQFLLWAGSINFLFLSVKNISNTYLAYIGAFLISVNLSYIALTLHALSDVTAAFVISWLIFCITRNSFDFKKVQCFYIIILFFSILSVLKPIFFPILILCVTVIFPLFYLKRFLRDTRKYLLPVVLTPVIIQFSIMIFKHHTFSLSTKGSFTLNQYFFAQGYAETENISIDEVKPAIKDKSFGFMFFYMLNHPKIFCSKFFDNIVMGNLKGSPTFLTYPPEYKHPVFYGIMKKLNNLFFLLHLLFILPCLFMIFYSVKRRLSLVKPFLFFYALFWYLVLIMGIAFWQGDRYTITIQPIWIIIYSIVICQLICKTLIKPGFHIKS